MPGRLLRIAGRMPRTPGHPPPEGFEIQGEQGFLHGRLCAKTPLGAWAGEPAGRHFERLPPRAAGPIRGHTVPSGAVAAKGRGRDRERGQPGHPPGRSQAGLRFGARIFPVRPPWEPLQRPSLMKALAESLVQTETDSRWQQAVGSKSGSTKVSWAGAVAKNKKLQIARNKLRLRGYFVAGFHL